MQFTLLENDIKTIKELMDSVGYVSSNVSVDDDVLVKIQTTTPLPGVLYVEWNGVKIGGSFIISNTESAPIPFGEIREFSIRYSRLNTVRLLACNDDMDILITLL